MNVINTNYRGIYLRKSRKHSVRIGRTIDRNTLEYVATISVDRCVMNKLQQMYAVEEQGVQNALRRSLVVSECSRGVAARRRSLGRQEHYQPASSYCRSLPLRGSLSQSEPWPERVPEVDGLVGEQAVGVGGVVQRQRQRRRLGRVLAEGVVRDARAHRRLAVRPAQPQPLQPQRRHGLALQDQLRQRSPITTPH